MVRNSLVVSLLAIILNFVGIFGFIGGDRTKNPSASELEDFGSAGQANSLILPVGGKVQAGDYVQISGNIVNLRSGPGTNYPILGQATNGQVATLEGGNQGWVKLRFQDNLTGWIADWLVKPAQATAGIPRHVPPGTQVLGYYATSDPGDTSAWNSLITAKNQLTGIVPFLFTVDSYGNISGENDWKVVNQAKQAGQTTLALVHNIAGNWFDTGVAHNLLSRQVNRTRAVTNIVKIIQEYGYNGVNIDFESIAPADRPYLTTFVRELSWALRPKGYLLTLSIPAKTGDDPTNKWSGAYDYKAIGEYADWIMLMAYDENYRTGSPGPVASIGWVEKVVKYATSVIPREKIILGVPGYGYDWPTNGKPGRSVSYTQAMAIAKANQIAPKWHTVHKVPYFSYVNNGLIRQVWFESSWSLEHKLKLVKDYRLKGIALWRLGLEDQRTWSVIQNQLF